MGKLAAISVLFVAVLMCSGTALAASVTGVLERDRAGGWQAWRLVPDVSLDEAWIQRGTERLPVDVGAEIGLTDTVVTRQARLRIDLPEKGEVTVYEDTTVQLQDWGLRHELGGLLIQVQGAFKVEYATAEAVVEGTRFRVEAASGGAGTVTVEEGVVRVSSPEGEVVLQAFEQALIQAGQAPQKQQVGRYRRAPKLRRFHPVSIGLQAGGGLGHHLGLSQSAGEVRVDLLGRVRLPFIGLTSTIGLVNSTTTSHFPASLGAEYWLGPVGVGAQGDLLLGYREDCTTGTTSLAISGAAHATVSGRLPITPRLVLDGRLLGGWSTGPQLYGTLGASYRL